MFAASHSKHTETLCDSKMSHTAILHVENATIIQNLPASYACICPGHIQNGKLWLKILHVDRCQVLRIFSALLSTAWSGNPASQHCRKLGRDETRNADHGGGVQGSLVTISFRAPWGHDGVKNWIVWTQPGNVRDWIKVEFKSISRKWFILDEFN